MGNICEKGQMTVGTTTAAFERMHIAKARSYSNKSTTEPKKE